VLVRHLVLPGHTENSLRVRSAPAPRIRSGLPLSVMSQFRPVPPCDRCGELSRPLRSSEYRPVVELVEELGFERVYIQPDHGDPDFLPDFSDGEPFKGNRRQNAG